MPVFITPYLTILLVYAIVWKFTTYAVSHFDGWKQQAKVKNFFWHNVF